MHISASSWALTCSRSEAGGRRFCPIPSPLHLGDEWLCSLSPRLSSQSWVSQRGLAWLGPVGRGDVQAAVVVGGMGASGTCIFQLGPSGSWAFGGGGEGGTAFRVPHPPFLLSQASLKCSRACPPPTLSWSRGILTLIMLLSPKIVHVGLLPLFHPSCIYTPFLCVCMCLWGRLSGKNLQQIESRSHHEADSFIAYF